MTRSEWEEVEKALHKPDVQVAMRGRCEEQGHQFDNGAGFARRGGAVVMRVYRYCRWCGETV